MNPQDYAIWPKGYPRNLTVPRTTLWFNLEAAATRYPDKPITLFYDSKLSYAQFRRDAETLAGFLQQRCGVRKGDRVLLDMQNSPQFMLAYYACLRADAVVVPVSPMNVTDELEHYAADSGARTALVAQDVYAQFRPLLGHALEHVVVATYADHLTAPTALASPNCWRRRAGTFSDPGVTAWHDALAAAHASRRNRRPAAKTSPPSSTPRARPANRRAACTPTTPSCARPWAARCGRAWRPIR